MLFKAACEVYDNQLKEANLRDMPAPSLQQRRKGNTMLNQQQRHISPADLCSRHISKFPKICHCRYKRSSYKYQNKTDQYDPQL